MKKYHGAWAVWAAALAFAIPTGLIAQADSIQADSVRANAVPTAELPTYEVGFARPPAQANGEVIEMSLEDAISRAMETNLSIRSARLSPEIQAYALQSARAVYRPTISGSLAYNNATRESRSQLDGGETTVTESQRLNTSISQRLPWWGAQISADFNNVRSETNSAFSTLNPSYSSSFGLSYSQPLLAGRRIDNQRAQIQTQELQTQITDLQVYSQVENVTSQVREAYWALRAAIEEIEIQRRNLEQAEALMAQNEISVQLGQMTEIQMAQTEAQVASAEQALLNAEIQWRNQEFVFKTLLLSGGADPLLTQTIVPTELPDTGEYVVDIDAAVQNALENRADIRQSRRQQEISEVNLEVSRTNTLPDLTLSAGYDVEGVGGNEFERGDLGGDPILVNRGDYFDALSGIGQLDTPSWSVTLNASIPVGLNADEANLERARLQLRQAELDLQSQELNVITQVTNAGLAVENTFLQLEAARRSAEASQRSAEAELQRNRVGVATLYEVNQAQDDLTSARLSELRAVINYVNAIAEFERVQRVGGGGF